MDISRLLISTNVEPTTSCNHFRPETHPANLHNNSNQQHLATNSSSCTPQSVPFCPLLPKPPGPLGAGADTRIPQELAELRGYSVKSNQRNQIAWPIFPGGWPGPCLLHPPHGTSRVKDKTPFSPTEDAAMLYLLENLGGSRLELLRAVFGRSYGNINIRRDELYGYRYCRGCPSCHMFMQQLFIIKEQYQGARWTLSQELSDGKIDVLVPPPRRIRSFEDFPLPIVARVRGRSRDLSLTVTSGASSDQWMQRTLRSRCDHCYIFRSRALNHTGNWTLRLYTCDESDFSVGFEISCVD